MAHPESQDLWPQFSRTSGWRWRWGWGRGWWGWCLSSLIIAMMMINAVVLYSKSDCHPNLSRALSSHLQCPKEVASKKPTTWRVRLNTKHIITCVYIYIYTMYYRGKKENTCDSSHFSTSDCLVSPWKISLASGRPPLSPLVPSFWTSSWYDLSGWNPRFRIQSNEVPTQFMVQILGKAYLEWWRNKPQKKVLRDGLVWKTTLQRRIQ